MYPDVQMTDHLVVSQLTATGPVTSALCVLFLQIVYLSAISTEVIYVANFSSALPHKYYNNNTCLVSIYTLNDAPQHIFIPVLVISTLTKVKVLCQVPQSKQR